jgi:hypothetical protein
MIFRLSTSFQTSETRWYPAKTIISLKLMDTHISTDYWCLYQVAHLGFWHKELGVGGGSRDQLRGFMEFKSNQVTDPYDLSLGLS